jgi:hypothetical protein
VVKPNPSGAELAITGWGSNGSVDRKVTLYDNANIAKSLTVGSNLVVVGTGAFDSNVTVAGNMRTAVSDLSPLISLANSPLTASMNGGMASLQEVGNPGGFQFWNGFFGGTDGTGNPNPPAWNQAKLFFRGCPTTAHSTSPGYTEYTPLAVQIYNGSTWTTLASWTVADGGYYFGYTSQYSPWFTLPAFSTAAGFVAGGSPTAGYLGLKNNSTQSDYKVGLVHMYFKS